MNRWNLFMNQWKLYLDTTHGLANSSTPSYVFHDNSNFVKALVSKINKLDLESKQLKHKSIIKASTFTWRKIKMLRWKFIIFRLILFNNIHCRMNTPKKLTKSNEFQLALMWL